MTYKVFAVLSVFVLFVIIIHKAEDWEKAAQQRLHECQQKAKLTGKESKYMYGDCYVKIDGSWIELSKHLEKMRD